MTFDNAAARSIREKLDGELERLHLTLDHPPTVSTLNALGLFRSPGPCERGVQADRRRLPAAKDRTQWPANVRSRAKPTCNPKDARHAWLRCIGDEELHRLGAHSRCGCRDRRDLALPGIPVLEVDPVNGNRSTEVSHANQAESTTTSPSCLSPHVLDPFWSKAYNPCPPAPRQAVS